MISIIDLLLKLIDLITYIGIEELFYKKILNKNIFNERIKNDEYDIEIIKKCVYCNKVIEGTIYCYKDNCYCSELCRIIAIEEE